MKHIITAILILLMGETHGQGAEVVFTINEKDIIPEGIAWDPSDNTLYVGSIQKSKILRISPDGSVTDFVKANQDNINQVLGMKVDGNRRLWACNNTAEHDTVNKISSVHIYDLKSGKLFKSMTLSDGKKHLFNDLYFTIAGDTYITDSMGGAIYLIRKGSDSLEEFLKPGSLIYPNGITATRNDKKLIVSTGSGLAIVSVDLQTKEIVPISHPKFFLIGADGLYRYKNSLIGVQNVVYPEGVLQYTLSEDEGSVTDLKYLISNHATFDTPTTGVIAGDDFYFIANSQLTQIEDDGELNEPQKLKNTVILKIKLP